MGYKPTFRKPDGYWKVEVYSKELFDWLNSLKLVSIPEIFDKGELRHFVRGVYDSEGCLTIGKKSNGYPDYRIRIVNTNRILLETVQRILDKLGIPSNLGVHYKNRKGRKDCYVLDLHSKKRVLKFLGEINSKTEVVK